MEEKNCCCHDHDHDHSKLISADSMPDDGVLSDAAELLKIFGDPTRLRIMYILGKGELCVCDIAKSLEMTQSAISHQLRVLKQARLVKARRSGKTIFYSLCDSHVQEIILCALEHVME